METKKRPGAISCLATCYSIQEGADNQVSAGNRSRGSKSRDVDYDI